MEEQEIIVSIRCLAYNQEKYIEQCLDGFIMQKTNFRFQAIVHDDASTDNTATIINKYAKLYPKIIVPIFESSNLYSKKDGSLGNVMAKYMKGKYIAICEGDDYWIDPNKLQKQVDFLENNPDYSMCFHQAYRHKEGADDPDELYSDIEDKDYTGEELYMSKHRPPTASILMRKSVIESNIYKECKQKISSFGDLCFFLSSAHCGKVHGMNEVMSVYRMNNKGVSNVFNTADDKALQFADDNLLLYKIFGKQYKKECINVYVIDYINHFFRCLHMGNIRPKLLYRPFLRFPIVTIKLLTIRLSSHYNL